MCAELTNSYGSTTRRLWSDSEVTTNSRHVRFPSPVQSLPNELLSRAFMLAAHHSNERRDTMLSPLSLSQVCRHWRSVALSSRSLWTTVTLTFPTSISQLLRAVAWLQRSGTCPLDILLDFRDPSWDWDEEAHRFRWQHMETVTRLLLPHVTRWKIFELLTDTWAPIFTFLHYTQSVESAPMLRSLALSRCNAYVATSGMNFQPMSLKRAIPLFDGALNALQEISLAGVHLNWRHSGLRNLVTLELKYHAHDVMPSLKQFVDLLSASPELEKLSIVGWGPQFHAFPGDGDNKDEVIVEGVATKVANLQRSIHLPRLTCFSFGFIDVDYAIELLSLFRFPALRELILEDVSASLSAVNTNDASHLLGYLVATHGSSCPSAMQPSAYYSANHFPITSIHTLVLQAVRASERSMNSFMRSLTSLRRLSLFNMESKSLRALYSCSDKMPTSIEGADFCLPCVGLSDLTCRDIDPSVLIDVIFWRSRHGFPLRRVLLDVCDRPSFASDQERAALRDAGVQLICQEDLG